MSSKLKSRKVYEKTNRRGLIRILALAAIIVSVVFVGYTIINDNIKIRENNERLKDLKTSRTKGISPMTRTLRTTSKT